MLIGYARVSTNDQDTALQTSALKRAGVRVIHQEKISAVKRRPALQTALSQLTPGATLVVYKVDRLARSMADLIALLALIETAGAGFKSLTEPIDTSTPAGRMSLHLLGAFAEFERAMIRERTKAGVRAAMERGAKIGRPHRLTPDQERLAYKLMLEGMSSSKAASYFGIHISTAKRIRKREAKKASE
jgi:DNA invertase Pin-like site-specific DNA recombinase